MEVKPAIQTLRLCHRFGVGKKAYLPKLPQELVEEISTVIYLSHRQEVTKSWVENQECFEGECRPKDHFTERKWVEMMGISCKRKRCLHKNPDTPCTHMIDRIPLDSCFHELEEETEEKLDLEDYVDICHARSQMWEHKFVCKFMTEVSSPVPQSSSFLFRLWDLPVNIWNL